MKLNKGQVYRVHAASGCKLPNNDSVCDLEFECFCNITYSYFFNYEGKSWVFNHKEIIKIEKTDDEEIFDVQSLVGKTFYVRNVFDLCEWIGVWRMHKVDKLRTLYFLRCPETDAMCITPASSVILTQVDGCSNDE